MWIEITDQLFWKTEELLGENMGPTTEGKSDLVLRGLRSADGKPSYAAFVIVNVSKLEKQLLVLLLQSESLLID